jgi:hypothetical protein
VRVRVVLAIALLLTAGALALDMSGRAPRLAGTDHVDPLVFAATVPGGHTLCQPGMVLPPDAASVTMLVGTFGHPVPALAVRFLDDRGVLVARGSPAPGTREGNVTVALSRTRGAAVAGTLCLANPSRSAIVLGGESATAGPGSVRLDGSVLAGRIDVAYLRPGRESWWHLLPTLDERFGLGKASFFGDWTLPAVALALAGVWAYTVWLLLRELRDPAEGRGESTHGRGRRSWLSRRLTGQRGSA